MQVNVGTGKSRLRLLDDTGALVIQDVRLSDQGAYVCKADNIVGTRETNSAKLRVLSE